MLASAGDDGFEGIQHRGWPENLPWVGSVGGTSSFAANRHLPEPVRTGQPLPGRPRLGRADRRRRTERPGRAARAAYGKLVKALRKRFGHAEADELRKIAQTSGDDETTRNRLAAALAGTELRPDDPLVVRAQALLAETKVGSKYVVDVQHSWIVPIGDHNTMKLDFRTSRFRWGGRRRR